MGEVQFSCLGGASIQEPTVATEGMVSLSSISATESLSRQEPVRGFHVGNRFTLRLQDGTQVQVEVYLNVASPRISLRTVPTKWSVSASSGLFSIRGGEQLQKPIPLRPPEPRQRFVGSPTSRLGNDSPTRTSPSSFSESQCPADRQAVRQQDGTGHERGAQAPRITDGGTIRPGQGGPSGADRRCPPTTAEPPPRTGRPLIPLPVPACWSVEQRCGYTASQAADTSRWPGSPRTVLSAAPGFLRKFVSRGKTV